MVLAFLGIEVVDDHREGSDGEERVEPRIVVTGILLQDDADLRDPIERMLECSDRLRATHAHGCQDMREHDEVAHRNKGHDVRRQLEGCFRG